MKFKTHFFTILFLYCLLNFPVKAQVSTQDSLVLVTLYNTTDGNNWFRNTNWLTGPVDSWFGVTVTANRVSSIELAYEELSGSIPPELGNLSNLQELNLNGNQLSGSIPPELANLSSLERLELSFNQLTGFIPPELGNLVNLQVLELEFNQLNGTIPMELANLINLQRLYLNDNQLTGSIPPNLGNLSNLVFLRLNDNQLTGSIPPELGNLDILRTLVLARNQLTGSIPPNLGNLNNLVFLRLTRNQLTGTIPPELGNLDILQELWLDFNELTGSIPPELGNLSNLQVLNLFSNQLTSSIPQELGDLSNLREFNLGENQLNGSIPPAFGNLGSLQELSFNYNGLSGPIPLELGNLSNLTSLGLSVNQLTGSIPVELGNLVNLRELYLNSNQLTQSIDFSSLPNLSRVWVYNNNLEFIDISGSPNQLWVQNNNLEFDDLEPYIAIIGFQYNPQKDILRDTLITASESEPVILSYTVPGTANAYQWVQNGNPVTGATTNTLSLDNLLLSDEGNYTLEVTNTLVPGLTLTYTGINVDVVSTPVVNDLSYSIDVGENLTINIDELLINPGDSVNVRLIGSANFGTITLNPDQSISYQADSLSFGTDTFEVEVCNIIGTCDLGTIIIEVLTPSTPIAADLSDSLPVGSQRTYDVIANSTYEQGQTLNIQLLGTPQFGASTITADQSITYTADSINYTTEMISYELCNQYGLCDSGELHIEVINTPPIISVEPVRVEAGGRIELDISDILIDPNGFPIKSAQVVQSSTSITRAEIDFTQQLLILDYSGSFFTGVDKVTIEACDLSDDCSEEILRVIVGELDRVNVYNAVTPNGDGRHDFLELEDLEFFNSHSVTIIDRWGEVVFKRSNYSNTDDSNSFTGLSDNGKELTPGTFFYYITLVSPEGNQYSQSGSLLLKK